jgi:DNA-binding transcriptional MocR family regulator
MSVELLLNLDDRSKRSLQKQIVDQIAFAIMNGNVAPDQPLPSSRHLSSQLGVGRNTVVLAYQTLLDDGYLVSIITNVNNKTSSCVLFNAKDIVSGPICSIPLPQQVCSGTHATWAQMNEIMS